MTCSICGKLLDSEAHLCTPDLWKMLERIAKLEARVTELESQVIAITGT